MNSKTKQKTILRKRRPTDDEPKDEFPVKFCKVKARKILMKIVDHDNPDILGLMVQEDVPPQFHDEVYKLVLESLELSKAGLLQ